jgi:hypothetical protein
MGKFKLGLQKEVSRIFTGIAVPGKKSPAPSGEEQAKAGAADGKITNCPAVLKHQVPPAVHTPPAVQPASVSPPPKDVVTPPPAVTPTQQVVTPAPTAITPSQVVTPAPTATTPSQVVTPAPVAVPKTVSVSKPAPQNPRPFSIPEPPQSKTPAVKSPVYEPSVRKQGVYESPLPSMPSAEGSAKQQKVEIISMASGWQRSVLKILRPITDKLLAPRPGISPLRQKATLVIIAILPLVLIFVLPKVFTKPAKTGTKSAKTTVAAAVNSEINWQIPPPLPENFRDPMVFGSSGQGQQEQAEAGPIVKGIVYSEDNPCAVVGERIVSAGDTVNGATVVKINPDSVEFASGDKKWSQKVER